MVGVFPGWMNREKLVSRWVTKNWINCLLLMPKKQKNWTTSVRLKGFGLSSHSRRVFSLCHLMVVDPDPPVRLQHQEKIWSLSPGAVFPFSSVIRGICSETRQPQENVCSDDKLMIATFFKILKDLLMECQRQTVLSSTPTHNLVNLHSD